MGLGSTAKKLQRVADMAEDVYQRLNDLREQVVEMRETVEETERRTDRLESEIAEQRELIDALAADAGLDADEVAARAHIGEAEDDHGEGGPTTDAADGSPRAANEGTEADSRENASDD
ncbi:MAG: DUF5798 family protein [Haloferacaceae archaeon]